MSKICIQCDSKIGVFRTALEGVYCSVACRDASHAAIARRAVLPPDPQPSRPRLHSERVPKAHVHGVCPKCEREWSVAPGAGPLGAHAGQCRWCGYGATFVAIERCATCRSTSLVMETPEDGRCPRCKTRAGRYRRLSA